MPVQNFGNSSEYLNYPVVNPTLDLNFALTKTLDPRITFTRASSGTYVGNDGLIKTAAVDEPRFDHNPTTGESLGLLVEEQRTNLLLRSEEFDNASWTKNGSSVTANQIAAPDGNTTADKLVESTANSVHMLTYSTFAYAANTTYTLSVYVKSAERFRGLLTLDTGGIIFPSVIFANFNLSTKAITASGTGASATITELSNGWFRVSLTATTTATGGTSTSLTIRLLDNTGTSPYTGDDTSGIYVWGAQLEQGSFPTSYIPTTSATVTRSADVASITGANFTRWYRQDEGTVFARSGVNRVFDGTRLTLEFGDGTNNNRFFLANNGFTSASYFYAVSSGVSQVVSTSPNAFSSGFANNAITYKTDDFALVSNGANPVLDTSGTVPTVSALYIGKLGSTTSTNMWCGTLSRLTYWPKRLSNDQLRLLTQ